MEEKQSKGITVIGLIVTIIVMVIIAELAIYLVRSGKYRPTNTTNLIIESEGPVS